ncbi:MAG: glycosyltransferase family 2 protein [Actinomycetes bacterium]
MAAERRESAESGNFSASWPSVSVVMAVLDEERHLADAIAAILGQDYPGELEIVIALGPSRDRTDEIAAKLAAEHPQISTVSNPSGRTPAGLNLAVATARHPIIARVDGHSLLPAGYLKTAVALLESVGADNVGGIMAAEGKTPFEQAVAKAMTTRLGVGPAAFHAGGKAGPADTVYLGVFRRETLLRLRGYDETFMRAQDWELNYRIRESGGLVYFSPDLRVTYRPRGSAGAVARQYFNYGRWRRLLVHRYPGSANLRYLTPPAALIAVTGGLLLAAFGRRVGWAAPAGYVASVVAGAAVTGRDLPVDARFRLPFVYMTMHGSWAAGFLTGRPTDM